MDRIDKKILELLQENGQISNQSLSDKVALSPSPCLRRVKQLEETGYISKYVALLNPEKLNLQLTFIVLVGMGTHNAKVLAEFERIIKTYPEVVQCYLVAGQTQDYILKVIIPNLDEYQLFLLKKLTQIEGVKSIHSSIVLRKVVEKTALPLNHIKIKGSSPNS